jgi:membrane protease YdiL (CAAX protease family)
VGPSPDISRTGVDRRAVIFYEVLACALSWPLFAWRDFAHASWAEWPLPSLVKGLAPAFGPAIAGLVAMAVFRRTHRRTVSLFGTSTWRSALFALTPVALVAAWGVPSPLPHVEGAWIGAVFLAYGLLEETGWRGFLQDALRPLPPLQRYVSLGLLWGAWHFTTFLGGTPLETAKRMALMLALWIAGSWGLGLAVDRSHAVLVPGALHVAFNLSEALPPGTWVPVLGISGVVWALLLRTWASARETPLPASRQ